METFRRQNREIQSFVLYVVNCPKLQIKTSLVTIDKTIHFLLNQKLLPTIFLLKYWTNENVHFHTASIDGTSLIKSVVVKERCISKSPVLDINSIIQLVISPGILLVMIINLHGKVDSKVTLARRVDYPVRNVDLEES